MTNFKLAVGCDHGGYELKQEILAYLDSAGIAYEDFGCDSTASVNYPVYAAKVCEAIQSGDCVRGILVCGTGIGMSMAANKHKGIRAACCSDTFSARMTRMHNDANVL
ncbi:MAG: ribose 5-phosphate isomerase B, partial [Clostridia bacterium]|nr:ribose 5-phosphate isomerase B [Clostridia bacterium]